VPGVHGDAVWAPLLDYVVGGVVLVGDPHHPRLPLRQARLPLPRRPAAAARALRRMDPQDRRQDHHPRLTPAQLAWQPLFDNAKKIGVLLAEFQELTLAIVEASTARQQP